VTNKQKFYTWLAGPWLPRMFVGLYLLIGIATLRHSAYGFASIESGNIWLGLLSALAVDVLMILFAHGLRDGWRWDYAAGLVIPAVLSIYTQLLFAVSESQAMMVAPGAMWLEQAQDILKWRIVLLPAALPVLALVASLAGRDKTTHVTLEQYNRIVALKSELESELDDREPQLEQMRTEAQSQQGVVKDLQGQLVSLSHELAAAEGWLKLTGKMRAQIVASMNGDGTLSNKEIAKLAGTSASNASRAVKEQAERF